jgi:hypothetical protein
LLVPHSTQCIQDSRTFSTPRGSAQKRNRSSRVAAIRLSCVTSLAPISRRKQRGWKLRAWAMPSERFYSTGIDAA